MNNGVLSGLLGNGGGVVKAVTKTIKNNAPDIEKYINKQIDYTTVPLENLLNVRGNLEETINTSRKALEQ